MTYILNYTQFVNENLGEGAITVFESGQYRITINKRKEPTHIVLFYQDEKVGVLNCHISDQRFDFCGNETYKFYGVSYVEINKEHRNKGFGKKLYQILQEYRGDVKGLISHLPDRVNKKQIPKIYKNFKTIIEGDNHIIIYDDSIIVNKEIKKPIKKEKEYYYSHKNIDNNTNKGIWISTKPMRYGSNNIYHLPNNSKNLDVYSTKFRELVSEFGGNKTLLLDKPSDEFIDFLLSKGYTGIKDLNEILLFK